MLEVVRNTLRLTKHVAHHDLGNQGVVALVWLALEELGCGWLQPTKKKQLMLKNLAMQDMRFNVSTSVARAREAMVSMIKLIHKSCTARSGDSPTENAPISASVIATILMVSWN